MNFLILSLMIFTLNFLLAKSQAPSYKYVADQSTVNEYTRDLANLKGISSESPYTKFRATCHRFNACMLSRSQKMEVCNILLTNERYSYIFGPSYFPLIICKKTEITIEPHSAENSRPMRIYAFKCHLPVRAERLGNEEARFTRNHFNMAYYVSSGNSSSWALMYYSHASSKPKIKPDIAIVDFPTQILSNLRNKERSKMYLPNPFSKKNNFSDVSPSRLLESTNNLHMSWSPLKAEENLQTFVTEIKENKYPYSRFRITCHHANVCNLTGKQRADSCKHSFERSKYNLLIGASTTIDKGCKRKRIFFEYREMPPSTIAVLNCPLQPDVSRNLYYLSAAESKDDFIAYMQVHPHEELLADAIIHKIADIVKPRRIKEPQKNSETDVPLPEP